MRAPVRDGTMSSMRWLCLLLAACSGPSPIAPVDGGADAPADGGADAPVAASLDLQVLMVQGGIPIEGELHDSRHRVEVLAVGVRGIEWKSDVREELYVPQERTVDLLGSSTLTSLELPPGRYSEVELRLRSGPWGPALAAVVDGRSVQSNEELDLEARCEGPLELRVGQGARVVLEIDGDRLLEVLADGDPEDPIGALRDGLNDSLRLACR